MSNDIIAPPSESENPWAEQDAILSAAADEYREMVAAGEDPTTAARIIDISLGLTPFPPPSVEDLR